MNDKFYIIVSGEYSDWKIHGFTRTISEAKEICDAYNRILKDGIYSQYSNYYFIETNLISKNTMQQSLGYLYEFRFDWRNKELVEHGEADISLVKKSKNGCYENDYGNEVETGVSSYYDRLDSCYAMVISFVIDSLDEEKANKIKQDMLAEYLYQIEVEGFPEEHERISRYDYPRYVVDIVKLDTIRADIQKAMEYLNRKKDSGN